jgi:hypothetical protein
MIVKGKKVPTKTTQKLSLFEVPLHYCLVQRGAPRRGVDHVDLNYQKLKKIRKTKSDIQKNRGGVDQVDLSEILKRQYLAYVLYLLFQGTIEHTFENIYYV